MIVEYIRYRIGPEHRHLFLEAYAEAKQSLEASPHCLAYELAQCGEEPACLTLRIEWDSAEGHLTGFRKSDQFPSFLAAVRPFLADIEEMRHYEPTAIAWRRPQA